MFSIGKSKLFVLLIALAIGIGIVAATGLVAARCFRKARIAKTLTFLSQLDSACAQWAIDRQKSPGVVPEPEELAEYIKVGELQSQLSKNVVFDAFGYSITLSEEGPRISQQAYEDYGEEIPACWSPNFASHAH